MAEPNGEIIRCTGSHIFPFIGVALFLSTLVAGDITSSATAILTNTAGSTAQRS